MRPSLMDPRDIAVVDLRTMRRAVAQEREALEPPFAIAELISPRSPLVLRQAGCLVTSFFTSARSMRNGALDQLRKMGYAVTLNPLTAAG